MADLLTAVYDKLVTSVSNMASGTVDAIAALVVIVVFFVIGYIVAHIISKIICRLIDQTGIEKRMRERGWGKTIAGFTIKKLANLLIKAFVVLAFLGAAADVVSLGFLTEVIRWAVAYIPSLVQGMIIIVAALMFADYVGGIIKKSKEIPISSIIAIIVQFFIGFAALIIVLPMILPAAEVGVLVAAFQSLVLPIGIGIGVGSGIAIGWGLKDSISSAAKRHQKIFDNFFGKVEQKMIPTKKRR